MKHNRRTSDVELIPNGPLLLTLPELAAHLRIDGEPHAFFLEFDRGTEGNRQYATKLSAYYRYRHSGLAARDYNGFPTVLFVTTDPRAEHRIAEAARRVAFIRGGSPLQVLTTSTARIQSHEGGILWGLSGCRTRLSNHHSSSTGRKVALCAEVLFGICFHWN